MKTEEEKLELRMYSLVLYQLTGIQVGIQSGHANIEYGVKYGFTETWLDWAKNWKTVILLNGGSSINLTSSIDLLKINNIKYCEFIEPDLYNQVTAVSFIVDERVFDKKKYPDFNCITMFYPTHAEKINDYKRYQEWVISIGGEKNAFLREFLKNFKLA